MNFTQTQTTSTSMAWQYKQYIEVTPKGLNITGQYVLPQQLLPNPQVNDILIMQCLRIGTNS